MITDDMVWPVGRIFKPHGYKGEMNVDLNLDKEALEVSKPAFFVKIDNILVPFFVEKAGGGASGTAFIKFKGVDSDKEAAKFDKKEMYVLKSWLSSTLGITEDEFEREANGLKGYEVLLKETGETLGTVSDVEEGVEYDYLVVTDPLGEKTFSIPFIEEFIEEIEDPKGKEPGRVTVELPEGFLDI